MDSVYSTVDCCRDFSAVLPGPKMGDHELPMHDYDNMPPPAGKDGFSNYQFTFNCAASGSNSGGTSFIEPDPDAEDIDSESLTDSVQNFPEEFGRTYHAYKAGSYAFPNDDIEIERLDLQNEIMLLLFGGRLYFAPFSKKNPPRNILDIATGTGEWAIKMGDEFPKSEVVATDLSPIQPNNVPPNVNFYVEDSSQEWDYTQKFDYIHTRVTAGCWSSFETQVARQAFDHLEPGGWFESQEFDAAIQCDDDTLDEDSALFHWYRDLQVAAEILDRPLLLTAQLKGVYQRVGFVDIKERVFKVPINGWPKDERYKQLGRMWERNLLEGLSGFSFHLFNRAFGRTMAQIEVALMDVRQGVCDTRVHAYTTVHVVTGRKPFPGEVPGSQKWFQ